MLFRMLFVSLAVCLLSTGSFAYDVDQLIADAKAFHLSHIEEIGDLTIEQEAKFTAPGTEGSNISYVNYQKGEKWRNESEIAMAGMGAKGGAGGMKTITIFDGTDVWSISSLGMKTKLPKDHENVDESSSPSYWREPPAGSKIVGDETVDGRDCWIVEWPSGAGGTDTPIRTWIDKKKFVNVKSEAPVSGKLMKIQFSDFRTVDGDFEIPYRIDIYTDDAKSMEITTKNISWSDDLSDDLFDPEQVNIGGQENMMNLDLEKMMKQAEEMKKQAEEMQKKHQKDE